MSKEYIEIDKSTFPTPFKLNVSSYARGWNACLNSVLRHKTADVAPVVHGEWIECGKDDNDMTIVQCSICQIKRYGAPAYCSRCGAKMDGGNKSLPFGIQRSAEEVGSALKELYNNLSRCHKCVYEIQCSKDKDYDRNCPLYKRDPKDGGYYG